MRTSTRIVVRPGTFDRHVVENVLGRNEYRLPPRLPPQSVVVDVGLHIGVFARAVLDRGAERVYGIEPDYENFALAVINLREDIQAGRAVVRHGAVWRSDPNQDVLYHAGPTAYRGDLNTGGGAVTLRPHGRPLTKIAFDDLILEAAAGGPGQIELVKLDCEGAEWPILFTSRRWDRIEHVCGEFHAQPAPPQEWCWNPRPRRRLGAGTLVELLEAHGFEVALKPVRDQDDSLGWFFATRPGSGARARARWW